MKFVPVMVTGSFTWADDDENDVRVGGPSSVNAEPLLVTLLGLVTVRGPVAAPAGTCVWIVVLLQLSMVAVMLLENFTEPGDCPKFEPEIVIGQFRGADEGFRLVMTGVGGIGFGTDARDGKDPS